LRARNIFIIIMACAFIFLSGCGKSEAPSSEKAITAFSIGGAAGTINETTKIILVTLPSGTDFTALVGTFTTTGEKVKVGTTAQISGVTANDFTLPVTYTVTAADSSTQTYMVIVIEPWKIISTLNFYSSYSPSRLTLQNGLAYLADGSIRIIDLSTPTAPSVLSTIVGNKSPQLGIFDIMTNVSVSNNKMLVGAEIGCTGWCSGNQFAGNLYVYDITNPTNPVRTSYLGMGTGDILLDGNIAYVTKSNTQPQFNVIDVSVQPQAGILGSANIPAYGRLAKTGNLMFISCGSGSGFDGLDTVDITTQVSPSVLHTGSSGWYGVTHPPIVLSGNAAYIADKTYGLRVLDISNPASPLIVLTISALSSINDVAVYNGYLYAADGASGIRVFDISNPLNPVYTRTIPTTPYAAKLVAVNGGLGVAVLMNTSNDYYFGVFLPQ